MLKRLRNMYRDPTLAFKIRVSNMIILVPLMILLILSVLGMYAENMRYQSLLEAAGQKCGSDIMNGEIMVISFDGVNENAIQYCLDGTISLIVECNPLHGPRVEAILRSLEKGETPEAAKRAKNAAASEYTATAYSECSVNALP